MDVRFLKLEVPQLYLPIHPKTKAHNVSEMTGIFGLRKCRVCNILVATMTIWLTQLSELFKRELQVYNKEFFVYYTYSRTQLYFT